MTWLEDVRSIVETLPRDFVMADLEPFYPGLKRLHPANSHVEAKVRQMLQNLVDTGELERVERGTYHRTGSPAIRIWPLQAGDTTSRKELAEILGMDGIQGLNRGMFKLRTGPHNRDLLLFQQFDSIYADEHGPDQRVIYVGMGQPQHGDQKWEGMNRYLGEHLELGISPHLFRQVRKGSPELEYQGEFLCEGVHESYVESEGRTVLEFELAPVDSVRPMTRNYAETLVRMSESPQLEPYVQSRSRTVSKTMRAVRDRAFASVVRAAYGQRCAVCGDTLARGAYVDLQGAHVRAVADGGPDEINNGMCLCARHHWGFDHGIFSLRDDHTIWLHAEAGPDPHGELTDGDSALVPDDIHLAPHPTYLQHHRATFSFR